jgi:3-methylcrotonyl-CoA carboxylase alpha subunit
VSDFRDGAQTRSVTLTPLGENRFRADVDGAVFEVRVEPGVDGRMRLEVDGAITPVVVAASGDRRFVRVGRFDYMVERIPRGAGRRGAQHGHGLEAPMPGVVTRVMAAAGDAVTKGQPLVAIEAMKMEHMIRAPRDGVVKAILAETGQMVDGGAALVEMDADGA